MHKATDGYVGTAHLLLSETSSLGHHELFTPWFSVSSRTVKLQWVESDQ